MINLEEERKLWKKGYKWVVGLDEAGRGALAGPVVAAAVVIRNSKFEARNSKQILNPNFPNSKFVWNIRISNFEFVSDFGFRISDLKLRDSKKLSQKQREKFYKLITRSPVIEWAIGRVSEKVIDKINILEATKLAMKKAVKNLKNKLKNKLEKFHHGENILIIDGKMKLDLPISQKSIIKADEKILSCAFASIVAKVSRDRMMQRYHKKYPQYGFDKHKGYPTKYHLKMLKKYGLCPIHRQSFQPVLKVKLKG